MTNTATPDSDTTGHDTATPRHDTHQDTDRDTGLGQASAWARVRAYGPYIPLPRRTLVIALYDGTADGTSRLWTWATQHGWDSLKTRGSALGGGAVVTAYTIATAPTPYGGILLAATTTTWAAFALIHAPSPAEKRRRAKEAAEAAARVAEEKAAAKAAKKAKRWGTKNPNSPHNANPKTLTIETQNNAPETPTPECKINNRTDLLHWLHGAIGERNGIHLDELHHRLSAEPGFTTLERAHLTPLLDRQDIPYHRAISVDGIAGRTGVKRADLQALLKASPTGGPQTP